MNRDDFQHFVCIVASEKPEEVVEKYDKNKFVETQLVYRYADREQIRQNFIQMYQALYDSPDMTDHEKKDILDALDYTKNETAEEFYDEICEDYGYTVDKETADAYCERNPNGKFSSIEIGKLFSIPFKLKDGTESYQARKKDIDWGRMHNHNRAVYEAAWDMVMEGKKPSTENEKIIYENMKNRTTYFRKYGNRENYVLSNTAFWGYAFVGDNQDWIQLEDNEEQFAWVRSYYDRFIASLPDDTLLTVMECRA